LSVEEQFYLIIPLVLAIVSIRSRAALTAVLLAFPFFVLGLYLANEVVLADVLSQFMTIGLGVACALHEDRARKIATALPGWTIIAALAAIFLLRGLEPTGTRSIMEVLLVPPLVMYVLLGSTFRRTILSAWLASRPVQTLGAASYSFYLWQQLATYPFPWAGGWFYAASLCACLLVAMASRRWLETPAIRVGTSLSRRIAHRQAAMVVATPP
jgi:peptidoglycan/LPS O-acetylase OafA/YrhL